MYDFTLLSCEMIRVNVNEFDKHFCFFHYLCLCLKTNQNDLSFAVYTQVLKIKCAMECPVL